MSQATHVYRNTRNGRLGEMTEEQAAIWPELLERVDSEPVIEPEVAPLVAPAPVIEADAGDPIPARSNKKD